MVAATSDAVRVEPLVTIASRKGLQMDLFLTSSTIFQKKAT